MMRKWSHRSKARFVRARVRQRRTGVPFLEAWFYEWTYPPPASIGRKVTDDRTRKA